MKHSRNVRCRFVRECELCAAKKCLWIGEQYPFPCRRGYYDVEEEITQPLPIDPSDCPRNNTDNSFVEKSHDSTNDGIWRLTVFALAIGCLIILLALALIWRYRKRSRETISEETKVVFQKLDNPT